VAVIEQDIPAVEVVDLFTIPTPVAYPEIEPEAVFVTESIYALP
jgi:hypothetical protein